MTYSKSIPYGGSNTLYAKPVSPGSTPSNSPWTGDDVASDSPAFGAVPFTGLTSGQEYWVFEQAGGSPANTDLVLGVISDNDLAAVKAKTDLIGANTVVLAPPALNDSTSTDIIIGDDYKIANDRQITFQFAAITGFTVGTCTGKFGAKHNATPSVDLFSVTASTSAITDIGGGMWQVIFEIDKDVTAALKPGSYDWSAEIVEGGEEVTVVKNTKTSSRLRLIAKQT